jgi:hypothetical protein
LLSYIFKTIASQLLPGDGIATSRGIITPHFSVPYVGILPVVEEHD